MTSNNRSNMIEYQYANFDPEEAMQDYQAVSVTLAQAQLALDQLNNTEPCQAEETEAQEIAAFCRASVQWLVHKAAFSVLPLDSLQKTNYDKYTYRECARDKPVDRTATCPPRVRC